MTEAFTQQIIDSSGRFGQSAAASGVLFERPQRKLGFPTYVEAMQALTNEDQAPLSFAISAQTAIVKEAALKKLGGLRVMVGVKTAQAIAYVPGVILPNEQSKVRIGCLVSPVDTRRPNRIDAQARLTDLQHLLLAKIAAEHQPDTGLHVEGRGVNGAEIGHAVVVAATANPFDIHKNVHSLVAAGTLSAAIAKTGATDIKLKEGVRTNVERVFGLDQIAGLVVVKDHQVPWPLEGDMFDLTAGFTYSAVQSQTDRPQPNLKQNIDNLLMPATV